LAGKPLDGAGTQIFIVTASMTAHDATLTHPQV